MKRTHEGLVKIGIALHGSAWQHALARDLNCSERAVYRWSRGADIPAGIWDELTMLCITKGGEMIELAGEIQRAA